MCSHASDQPIISQNIIDLVIVGQTDPATRQTVHHTEFLVPLVIGLILFALLRSALAYTMIIFSERSSQHTVYKIRNKLYTNMQQQDMRFYAHNRTGDLMTRTTGDLDLVRHVIAWISRVAVEAIVMFIATTIYLMTVDIILTLILLAYYASNLYCQHQIFQKSQTALSGFAGKTISAEHFGTREYCRKPGGQSVCPGRLRDFKV